RLAARPTEERPVETQRRSLLQRERLGDVGTVAVGLEVVAPHVQDLVFGLPDAERELASGLALRHDARGPVDRALAVALHVTAELRAEGRAGRAVEPLPFERLRAVPADLGDVAHQIPDLVGRRGHVDGYGILHGPNPTGCDTGAC